MWHNNRPLNAENYFIIKKQKDMFGSSKESDKKKDAINSQRNEIAHGTKIVGDVHFPGTIRFDGEIDGNITCESKIVIIPCSYIILPDI